MKIMKNTSGIAVLILGVLALFEAIRLSKYRRFGAVGDDTLPFAVAIALIVLGFLFTFIFKTSSLRVTFPAGQIKRKMIKTALVIVSYVFLMPYLGYSIGTSMVLMFLFRILGEYKWYHCIIWGIITAIILRLIFIEWLKMPLPNGIFKI